MESKADLLRNLDLGNIVAEHDTLLSQCFIRHPVLSEITLDRKDLVLGAKGAGKSALWKEIKESKVRYPSLANVELRLVTNPSGDPEFRDVLAAISDEEFPSIDDLRVGWRLYFLAQLWRGARELLPDAPPRRALDGEIKKYGVIPEASGLKVAFAFAIAKARALKELSIEWTKGLAVKFDDRELRAGGSAAAIPFNDILQRIDQLLGETGCRVWLVLDRLDEIILGDENRENQVLKGLLLAYRDVGDLANGRVKIFLRDDVYDRVTSIGHFPALTHVRSKAAGPIRWDLEDLLHLVVRRLLANQSVRSLVGMDSDDVINNQRRAEIFYALFPAKVDKGRTAGAFKWIVDRITDGNGVATPRDLLSVIDVARGIQIEQLEREAIELPNQQLFSEDTLRRAVRKVAKDNLETRIFAEYPDLRVPIEAFRGGKADHNDNTLAAVLGAEATRLLPRLQRVGFIFRRARNGVQMWTIPFLFSFALEITRGAAFPLPPGVGADQDDDEGDG